MKVATIVKCILLSVLSYCFVLYGVSARDLNVSAAQLQTGRTSAPVGSETSMLIGSKEVTPDKTPVSNILDSRVNDVSFDNSREPARGGSSEQVINEFFYGKKF